MKKLDPDVLEVMKRVMDGPQPAAMWFHECPIDGPMHVGAGEPCNWCGAERP